MHRIVILGGGTGGTLAANRLRKAYRADEARDHRGGPGRRPRLPAGPPVRAVRAHPPEDIVRPRGRQLHARHRLPDNRGRPGRARARGPCVLEDGSCLDYDVLVVATGAVLAPEETEGLTGPGWMERVFTFYTPEGAAGLEQALACFDQGRLVVNVVDLPIKCPVAPLEFCFLADWFLRERGVRDEVELTYVTPLDGAFTKPVAAGRLGGMLAERGHRTRHRVQHRRGRRGRRAGSSPTTTGRSPSTWPSWCRPTTGRRASSAPRAWATSSASSRPTSTPCSRPHHPDVFALGDAAALPISKAGSVTHFEGEVLVENVRRFLAGRATRRQLRRPRQLLHRDRVPQGDADRLQLRGGAAARATSRRRRAAAPEGVPPQPPGEADVPVGLLAQPAARPRPPRHPQHHAHAGQAADRPRPRKETTP